MNATVMTTPAQLERLGEHLRRKLTLDEAAMAKLFVTEELGRALDEMLQLYGGYGYMMEYPICRAYVDSRVTRIYGGTSEVHRSMIAEKGLGLPRTRA